LTEDQKTLDATLKLPRLINESKRHGIQIRTWQDFLKSKEEQP